jgi:hypothetical protein|uniref:Uncharacterized protein n=1 Tax=Zea mays TaxID=4577 RepID=A0A804MKU1_MAIZE
MVVLVSPARTLSAAAVVPNVRVVVLDLPIPSRHDVAGAKPDTATPPASAFGGEGGLHVSHLPLPPHDERLHQSLCIFQDLQKRLGKQNALTTVAAALPSPASTSAKAPDPAPAPAPKSGLPPLSEDEHWNLYKWILEEERKIKPRNATEKKIVEENSLGCFACLPQPLDFYPHHCSFACLPSLSLSE